VSNTELLRDIKGAICGASVSMLYTMCYGHAALHDALILPMALVTFFNKAANDSDVERWINALASRYVSTTSVLELFLIYLKGFITCFLHSWRSYPQSA